LSRFADFKYTFDNIKYKTGELFYDKNSDCWFCRGYCIFHSREDSNKIVICKSGGPRKWAKMIDKFDLNGPNTQDKLNLILDKLDILK